jgi:plasmid stabilization system protein ParE
VTPIVFDPEARRELDEAFNWYERQRPGLGLEFIASIDEQLALVGESPTRFAVVHRDLRQVHPKRFPYSIVYRVEEERIVVFAVFHGRRNPTGWKRRP